MQWKCLSRVVGFEEYKFCNILTGTFTLIAATVVMYFEHEMLTRKCFQFEVVSENKNNLTYLILKSEELTRSSLASIFINFSYKYFRSFFQRIFNLQLNDSNKNKINKNPTLRTHNIIIFLNFEINRTTNTQVGWKKIFQCTQ